MSETDRSRLARVEELFAAAKELPHERRAAFLAEQARGDEELRREVAALLELETGARGFLERPADPWVGRRIDRWRLLERIGAGGMGVVYLAARDDGVFDQKVALKLLKHGVEQAELLERFRRERQVLAGLSHPHIARLIDGGATPEGVPYLVMEYVAGKRLDHWCDERRLALGLRLALFRDVCNAVHYAHQNLVIHRDLKPSNVLVTAEGVAKLVDFGVSKVLEPDAQEGGEATRTIERRLTPEYASPEVVRGAAVTTASDVFSLGVMLYELLTGRRPWEFAESSSTDLERAICETTPAWPSAADVTPQSAAARATDAGGLRRALRGDLDAIVMTAIAPESDRRYASVAALAADLDRHAAGQPVVARAPGAAYVLSKFVRRHRGLVVAAVVAVLALVAGAAGLAAGAAKARRQAESTGRVNSLLREMLVRLEPTSARGFAQSLLSQLDYAKGELEKGLLRDDPAIEIDLRMALGRVYGALGYAGWARNEFSIAVAMAREHYPPRDARLVQMLRWLGWADRNCAQLGDAEAHLREAVELAGALGGLDDDRCTALNDLGLTLTALARYDDADQALEEALAHWRAIGKSESQGAAGVQAAIALNRLARGDAQAAEPSARIALALCQKLCPEADPRQAIALDTLARVLQAEGKLDEAEPLLERSLAIRRGLFDPKSPVIAWSLSLLAGVRVAAGNPSGAIPLLEEALAIRKIHYEPDSQVRVQALLELGLALLEAGERDAALPHLTEAVTIADQKGYPDEPRLARARSELAR